MSLLRPLNIVMIMAGVAVGALLAAGTRGIDAGGVRLLAFAALSAGLIGGAANVVNDVLDLAIDRVNRPERPLPSGRVSRTTATAAASLLALAGIAFAAVVSSRHAATAGAVLLLLIGYSAWLKRVPFAGNLVIAVLLGVTLLYGGWTVGPAEPVLAGACFAALTTLAREIIKDVDDVRGDRAEGARTLPIVAGSHAAIRVAVVVLLITIALTPLPFLLFAYGGFYLLLVLAADGLMLWTIALLQRRHPNVRVAGHVLKGAMLAGLVALAVAHAV